MELIIGIIIGSVASLFLARLYHKKSLKADIELQVFLKERACRKEKEKMSDFFGFTECPKCKASSTGFAVVDHAQGSNMVCQCGWEFFASHPSQTTTHFLNYRRKSLESNLDQSSPEKTEEN
jgi:rubredoxin